MSRNRTLGAPYEQAIVTASFLTVPHIDRYLVFAPGSGPAVTATLDPNAFEGDQVIILDAAGNAGTTPITIETNAGQVIIGSNLIDTNFGSIELTFSTSLGLFGGDGFWSVRTGSAIGGVAGPRESVVGPASNTTVPTVDGVGPPSSVMFALPTITAPIGSRLNINGYLQVANGSGGALTISVKIETTVGSGSVLVDGLFSQQELPATSGPQNVPINGDLVTTAETTTLLICAFAPAGLGLTAPQLGSFATVTQVG